MRKNKIWTITTVIALIIAGILGYNLFMKNEAYATTKENEYNMAFYEVVDYVQNVKTYLAKSMISKSAEHGAEMLTYVWREANLAQAYLGMLPIESQELENTEKYLNQVSEYSYSLSRKNIEGENLTDEDISKIKELYNYSNDLSNTLNEMSDELNNGTLLWEDLMRNTEGSEIAEVSTLDVIEENFHEYTGLIYDGAFSEHMTTSEPKMITGEEVPEEDAKNKVREFMKDKKIQEINTLEQSQNTNIPAYNFSVKTEQNENCAISVSKKGCYVVYSNCNRDIGEQVLSYEDANKKGQEFLEKVGIKNMQNTYYLNESGILTINYAYNQNGVIIYPDLIKVKVALDNGEILGFEATGYLNNHTERTIDKNVISKEQAKKTLNKNLNIKSENLAIIPTEYKTEILCYEFKGTVENREFIVYINAKTGEEEDILVIYNTPNGVLTM